MTYPISFRLPELRALDDGRLRAFRRLADGVLADVEIGTRLWIREPYFLPVRYDHLKPTSARDIGAQPLFLSDAGYEASVDGHGKLRTARELCRDWHRRHLVIIGCERQRIRDISAADIATAGYADSHHFRAHWDQDISMRGRGARWDDNPVVLRLAFEVADGQLPKAPAPERQSRRAKPAEPVSPRPAASGMAAAAPSRPAASPALALRPAKAIQSPASFTPPVDRQFCEQCDQLVAKDRISSCQSQFCDFRSADRKDAA